MPKVALNFIYTSTVRKGSGLLTVRHEVKVEQNVERRIQFLIS